MLTRAGVAELYSPIYDEFMLGVFNEETQVHTQFFEVVNDTTKEYKVDDLSGLGEWTDADEGSGGGYEDPVLGYPKTFTQAKFWKKFQVSFETVDQDEYTLLNKVSTAQAMGRGCRARVEKKTAAILYDGFATAGPDGQFLFDTDHPKNREETGTLLDNLLQGPFSHDTLEAAEKQIADNYQDLTGIPIEVTQNAKIAFAPALVGPITRVLAERAGERPGTPNRDINRFAGLYDPIQWRFLAAKYGGSDTAWYIIYKEMGMLKIVWSVKPHFTSWIDEENEFYKFKGRALSDQGATNWRFGFGSTGV